MLNYTIKDTLDQKPPLYYLTGIAILVFGYLGLRWGHSLAVENLNQINAANFKFKKVLDCSQDAICIVN